MLDRPLGDVLFDVICIAIGSIWVLGWVILLSAMLVETIFPKTEQSIEAFLQHFSRVFNPLQKLLFISAGVLLFIWVASGWLGYR